MKKPTTKSNLAIFSARTHTRETIERIPVVFDYPIAVHRSVSEWQEIQEGTRKRYSSSWVMSHIPTGMSFGVVADWDSIRGMALEIKDHPALLMLTQESMEAHPMYRDLCDVYSKLKRKWT